MASAGARVTTRGRRSFFGAGDPLLIVDGVRILGDQRESSAQTAFTGSRLDDLALEEIAAVEVLPGSAAGSSLTFPQDCPIAAQAAGTRLSAGW
ncbi:MAG TPA: hypothetical protein VGD56_05360 [Gemmatirosa sp.]